MCLTVSSYNSNQSNYSTFVTIPRQIAWVKFDRKAIKARLSLTKRQLRTSNLPFFLQRKPTPFSKYLESIPKSDNVRFSQKLKKPQHFSEKWRHQGWWCWCLCRLPSQLMWLLSHPIGKKMTDCTWNWTGEIWLLLPVMALGIDRGLQSLAMAQDRSTLKWPNWRINWNRPRTNLGEPKLNYDLTKAITNDLMLNWKRCKKRYVKILAIALKWSAPVLL